MPLYGEGGQRYKPFPARLKANRRISALGHEQVRCPSSSVYLHVPIHIIIRPSLQDIRHLEFDLRGSGLSYQPGNTTVLLLRLLLLVTDLTTVTNSLLLLSDQGTCWLCTRGTPQDPHYPSSGPWVSDNFLYLF